MPAIRLADIPNAGPQAAAASAAMIGAPSVPRYQVNPEVAQLGGAAMMDSRSTRNAAQSMLTQTLELDAFSQEARAMGKFADSIGGLGDVAMKWGQKFAEAKDSADISRAETILESAFQKQQTEQLGKPVEEWGNLWNQNQDQAKRKLAEIKFSNNAAEKVAPYLERWSTLSSLKIDNLAKKEEIKGWRADKEANALAKIANEDYEGAFAVMDESVKKGIHSPEESTLWKSRLLDDVQRKAKVQREANVESDIILDPIGSEKEAQEAVKNGKSSKYPWMEKSDAVRFFGKSRAEADRYRNQFDDDTVDLILTGQLSTPEEVREHAKDVLPENKIQSLLGIFAKTPAQIELGLKLRPSAYALADSYDPGKDDQNRSKYFATRDTILLLPEGEREEPLSILRKRASDTENTTALKQAVSQMNEMLDAGQFGKWQKGEDKKPLNDAEWDNYIAAGKRFSDQKIALENWAKNNPKEASDPEKVFDKLNKNLTYERQFQKYREEKDRPRWWWESPSKLTPPVPPLEADDALKKIRSKSSLNKNSSQKEIDDEAKRIDFDTPLPEMTIS
jgi:hypothetical protein